jgi:hypothetical protein
MAAKSFEGKTVSEPPRDAINLIAAYPARREEHVKFLLEFA